MKHKHLISLVASLVTSASTAYLGFQISAVLAIATTMLTGWMFLGFLILIIGCVLSCIYALRAGARAAEYIALGEFERDYQSAKSFVIERFGDTKSFVINRFNGVNHV